jgi:transposase
MSKSNGDLSNFNVQEVTDKEVIYIGLDVHKKKIDAAARVGDKLLQTWVMPADSEVVLASLEGIRESEHHIAYEAGPTGYELARRLRAEGFQIEVVAPGKTPQPANQGNKSDRLDCRKIAEYLQKDLLQAVTVPTRQEEADRQVLRLREQLVKKRIRYKQQIRSFLLQHDILEPEGLSDWKDSALQALRQLELCGQLRLALDTYLEGLKATSRMLRRVNRKVRKLAEEDRHQRNAELIRTHPGAGPVTSMAFLTEFFRPERFLSAGAVGKYIGLAPKVRQSGQTRIEGGRIPAGREGLRRILVQAAWRWVGHDPWAREKYKHLLSNTGSKQKAIVAMARRMAVNLWRMVTRQQRYIQGGP